MFERFVRMYLNFDVIIRAIPIAQITYKYDLMHAGNHIDYGINCTIPDIIEQLPLADR